MESSKDDSTALVKSWLTEDSAGDPFWPALAMFLADLELESRDYQRHARRKARLSFEDVRQLRRLLAGLAQVESKQVRVSTDNRTAYKEGSTRLQSAFVQLAGVEGFNPDRLRTELGQRFSPAWSAWLRLTLTRDDEFGARGTFVKAVEAAHDFTDKVRRRERLTPAEVDRLYDVVQSRTGYRMGLHDPAFFGYRDDTLTWGIMEPEFEAAYRRIGRVVPLLSSLHGIRPGPSWVRRGDIDFWDYRGGDPLGEQWRYLAKDGFWDELRRRAEQVKPSGEDAPDEVEPQAPALTEPQRITLGAMNGFDPSMLASAVRICDAIEPAQRLSEETIRQAVARLIELGLAERPEGERRGARLTLEGRRLSVKIGGLSSYA